MHNRVMVSKVDSCIILTNILLFITIDHGNYLQCSQVCISQERLDVPN